MPSHASSCPQSSPTGDAARLQAVKDLRRLAANALQQDDVQKAHTLLSKAKSLKPPLESIDYL